MNRMSNERVFPNSPRAVADARRYALETVGEVEPDVADALAVMVSELATNCIRHAATQFAMTVDRTPHEIRVAVTDSGSGHPAVRSPALTDRSGRGLQIVQAFADDWGVSLAEATPGKTVWFTVSLVERLSDAPRG
jgi:two-component sensor histidine kinase